MKFIVFSVFVWVLALFHVWDHRRFEDDLRARGAGDMGRDWHEVAGSSAETLYLKRGFHIRTRSDGLRYGVPVGFFFFWLVVLQSWWPALLYMAVIATKWLAATTQLHIPTMTYQVMLGRMAIFTGTLR